MSEPQIITCWFNARPPSFLYPFSYPPKVSNRGIFARILRTSTFVLAILKGAPCFEWAEVRGAGSRDEDCRQQTPATNSIACTVVPPSILLSYNGKIVRYVLNAQSGQSTCFVCLHSPSNPHLCISTFKPACMLLVLVLPFLIWVAKTSSLS